MVCVSGGGSAARKILMNQCLTFLVVYCPPLSKSDEKEENDWMVMEKFQGEINGGSVMESSSGKEGE